MLAKLHDIKRKRLFLDKETLARDAGVALNTLESDITLIEKEMGFKPGDLAALVAMSTNETAGSRKPCKKCGTPTQSSVRLCQDCKPAFKRKTMLLNAVLKL